MVEEGAVASEEERRGRHERWKGLWRQRKRGEGVRDTVMEADSDLSCKVHRD
jgi:hypothetical protein